MHAYILWCCRILQAWVGLDVGASRPVLQKRIETIQYTKHLVMLLFFRILNLRQNHDSGILTAMKKQRLKELFVLQF